MKNKTIIKIALEIASLRASLQASDHDTAAHLEKSLYVTLHEKNLPESEVRYILELTEPRVYQ